MKSTKFSFNFNDNAALVDLLRIEAARSKISQKPIVVDALKVYCAEKFENSLIYKAADKAFSEWDNEEDEVYNSI